MYRLMYMVNKSLPNHVDELCLGVKLNNIPNIGGNR